MWHHISNIVLRWYYTYQTNWNNSIKKNIDNDALWLDENDVDTMNVSDINCPNKNDGTTMPAINHIKGVDSKFVNSRCLRFYLSLI